MSLRLYRGCRFTAACCQMKAHATPHCIGCRHYAGASSNGSGKGASRKQAADSDEDSEEGGKLAAYAAPAAILTGLAILIGGGVAYKRELKDFIEHFVAVLDTWGPVRYALMRSHWLHGIQLLQE